MTRDRVVRRVSAWAAGALLALGASSARAEEPPGKEVAPVRYTLSPRYAPGQVFRVETRWRQSTFSQIPQGLIPHAPNPPFEYNGSLEIDAHVTIEKVDERGGAEVYAVRFDRMRSELPTPLQSKEYRDRARERKRKNLPPEGHPLEGATIRHDASGTKARIYRVLDSGEDAEVTKRYPEIVPVMQDLVDPDWTPVDSMPLGAEWEMNADHLFRITRVVAKAPVRGTIHCRLVSVVDGIARIAVTARLLESYAQIELQIVAYGTIEFDVEARRQLGSSVHGEVSIGGPRTGLRGGGTVTASKLVYTPGPPLASDPKATK
jgi:hypothetical protein